MPPAKNPPAPQTFPPVVLREYALLADGERGALIGPRGELAWMCAPRWDSPAVFASLIGGNGVYALTPSGRFVWGGYYEPGSLIWRSRWTASAGIAECREALAFPGEPERTVLLRRYTVIEGRVPAVVLLDLRAGFDDAPVRSLLNTDGMWTGRLGDRYVRWSGAADATSVPDGHRGRRLVLRLDPEQGRAHDLVLEISDVPIEDEPPVAEQLWTATRYAWDEAVPDLPATLADRDARHSYAVLRGLTASTGGMVAAATTSLPERAAQGRNYDYRYVWIRDQCIAGQAMAALGGAPLLEDAVRFVADRLLADGAQLKPAYTSTGGKVPDQHPLPLPGYPGGHDRLGNWVNQQFQLDAFGEALLLFASAARLGRLDARGWQATETAASVIAQRWQEPDAGIWEIDNQPWTHSRLICAAGLRQAAASLSTDSGQLAASWLTLADTIVAHTSATALHPSGRWQRSPTDPRNDAALLLPALRGALPADDPRSIATFRAYRDELTEDFFGYRFRQDDGPLGDAEGAFLLCGFIMALSCAQQGEPVAAARWFERTRSACGPPGLFSEEFDVQQRQLRGNLPQAFVHAMMLECAAALGR